MQNNRLIKLGISFFLLLFSSSSFAALGMDTTDVTNSKTSLILIGAAFVTLYILQFAVQIIEMNNKVKLKKERETAKKEREVKRAERAVYSQERKQQAETRRTQNAEYMAQRKQQNAEYHQKRMAKLDERKSYSANQTPYRKPYKK
jgi:hypothetical protein